MSHLVGLGATTVDLELCKAVEKRATASKVLTYLCTLSDAFLPG